MTPPPTVEELAQAAICFLRLSGRRFSLVDAAAHYTQYNEPPEALHEMKCCVWRVLTYLNPGERPCEAVLDAVARRYIQQAENTAPKS